MSWFFIALIAPTLWAVVNHIDKYLLSKHFKGNTVGALMLFSTLTAGIMLPIFYFISPDVLTIARINAVVLIGAGILSAGAIWLYLHALDDEEATIVIPLFQLIPIFGFIFAYVLLGETLTELQAWGGLLIIFGAIFITLEINHAQKIHFKWRVIVMMLGASIFWALYETLFKVVAVNEDFWTSIFWQHIGLLSMGCVLFCIRTFRSQFFILIKNNGRAMLPLNLGSETLTIIGNIAANYALLLAPVALVLVVNGVQPVIVFFIGILLTLFLPHIAEEKIGKWHLIHKATAIACICIGTILIQY